MKKSENKLNGIMSETRPLLNLTSDQWPGTPAERSVIASMEYTDKQVKRMFTENPGSRWIITPYEIIERDKFFAPKSAPLLETNT